MELPDDVIVKAIDVAKSVADTWAPGYSGTANIAKARTAVDEWAELFDRTYKAIMKTLTEEQEGKEE